MNKTFKLAISAVLGAAMVTPAFAQRDNFPDVKDTHWAFEAVNRLKKEGIITGYPDGTFKGKQFITRYELATLLYAIYTNLKNVTDGLDAQVKALDAKVNSGNTTNNGGGETKTVDTSDLKRAIESTQKEVSAMKAWGSDINTLKKMADSYQKELTSMGVDVEAMKKSLSDLDKRVSALENKKPAITITGDANFLVTAVSKGSNSAGSLNQDGKWQASGTNAAGLDTLRVNHELGLQINSADNKVHGEIVANSLLGGFPNQSQVRSNFGSSYNEGPTNVFINSLYVNHDDSLAGLAFSSKIGRQGMKLNPWVMSRLDNNSFYSNSRQDNGEFMVDGISAALKFGGSANLHLFIGRTSTQSGTVGGALQPITIGSEQGIAAANLLPISRVGGANLQFGLLGGNFNAAFVNYDADGNNGAGANRLEVTGIDGTFKLLGLDVAAGYGKSVWKSGTSSVLDTDNTRTNLGVSYATGALGLGVNYSNVEAAYLAPGDWGRTGIFRNLTNLRTTGANLTYKMNDKFNLFGNASRGEAVTGTGKVDSSTFGFNYKLNSAWDLTTSFETTEFKEGFGTIANSTYKFTTFGFGYNMGANSMFNLAYQVTDHTNVLGGNPNGGFIAAQFTVKF